jgi:hypothetical protein
MKRFTVPVFLFLLATGLTGCDVIGGIFEAGVWTGFLLVAVGIAVLLWLGSRLFRRR